jgi:hypothetical protein
MPHHELLLDVPVCPRCGSSRICDEASPEKETKKRLPSSYLLPQKAQSRKDGYRYVRWIATTDECTCKICASRHGLIYKLSDVFGKLHQGCRCCFSPVATEAVEEYDLELRGTLLRQEYWERSRQTMIEEYANANRLSLDHAGVVLEDAIRNPAPVELLQRPDIECAPIPITRAVDTAEEYGGPAAVLAVLLLSLDFYHGNLKSNASKSKCLDCRSLWDNANVTRISTLFEKVLDIKLDFSIKSHRACASDVGEMAPYIISKLIQADVSAESSLNEASQNPLRLYSRKPIENAEADGKKAKADAREACFLEIKSLCSRYAL